jgi:hypothetical protein
VIYFGPGNMFFIGQHQTSAELAETNSAQAA